MIKAENVPQGSTFAWRGISVMQSRSAQMKPSVILQGTTDFFF